MEDIMAVEHYRARKGEEIPHAAAAAAPGGYTIEVRFLGGLTPKQKAAFKLAANRWTHAIVGDLPDVIVGGERINNLRITAQGTDIDGPGRILGQAGPNRLRPQNAGAAAFLPATGDMQFDTADLAAMEADGTLNDVITHEMGHVIGIGTIWTNKKLLKRTHPSNPTFNGANAMREYGKLRGSAGSLPVPVENTGGEGTVDSHWRDTVFGAELMTGFVNVGGNPMSRVTIASLQDLGYQVNMDAAQPYQLPDHLHMAEAGLVAAHAEKARGIVLPRIPITLPEESLGP
ncbi:leishmanolysin-related zinc metalloendopeptidase [Bradyrhizobium sp. Arg816]|uniref:leishmanolysin-related zinc metalloendopeptidase n=1 Tax=Bradyrhizobium sp. Arg816 TaxID=2998491 RepID=UPI00249DD422|nr:leishmanolysin-related zinc metalloendopeptidase [Bradyrhizobium sp. Arg816]MDI3566253.1 leishmanolysin-related zinc metalloendopeptidase [Bradyrhizobium sp. Arg816]